MRLKYFKEILTFRPFAFHQNHHHQQQQQELIEFIEYIKCKQNIPHFNICKLKEWMARAKGQKLKALLYWNSLTAVNGFVAHRIINLFNEHIFTMNPSNFPSLFLRHTMYSFFQPNLHNLLYIILRQAFVSRLTKRMRLELDWTTGALAYIARCSSLRLRRSIRRRSFSVIRWSGCWTFAFLSIRMLFSRMHFHSKSYKFSFPFSIITYYFSYMRNVK